jgi:hypothetical protein
MPQILDDFFEEIERERSYQQRQRSAMMEADRFSPDQAALFSELTNFYPTVPSGVLRPLAMEGFGPDHPVTLSAITFAAFQEEEERGEYGARWGDDIRSEPPTINYNTDLANSLGHVTVPVDELFLPDSDVRNPNNVTEENADDLQQALINSRENAAPPGVPEFRQLEVYQDDDKEIERRLRRNEILRSSTEELIERARELGVIDEDGYFIPKHLDLSREDLDEQEMDAWDTSSELFNRIEQHYPYFQKADDRVYFETDAQGNAPNTSPERDEIQQRIKLNITADDTSSFEYADPMTQSLISIPGMEWAISEGTDKLRTGVSAGLTALEAVPQEIQGLSRSVYSGLRGQGWNFKSQSNLGIALPMLIRGEHVDLGNSWLPDLENTQVSLERKRREATFPQIDGHNASLGRILANGIGIEPDTKPFMALSGIVDGTVAMADPTILSKAGKVSKTFRTFNGAERLASVPMINAGGFHTYRLYVHGPTAERFLNKRGAQQLINRFTETTSPYEISKLTNHRIPEDVAFNLANQSTTSGTYNTLRNAINSGRIRETTQLREQALQRGLYSARNTAVDTLTTMSSMTQRFSSVNPTRVPRSVRMFQKMPGHVVDADNPAQAARTLTSVLDNAKATEDEVATIYNMVAQASAQNSRAGIHRATNEAMRMVNGQLHRYGIEEQGTRDLLTSTFDSSADLRGGIDEVVYRQFPLSRVNAAGERVSIPSPHQNLEYINRYINLPDQRAIRRLTSRYNFLTTRGGLDLLPVVKKAKKRLGKEVNQVTGQPRLPTYAMDWYMQQVWKPAQLLRLAWPIRVIGEGQARVAASDLSSAFRHPIDYLSFVIGSDESTMGRLLERAAPGVKRRGVYGADGELLESYEEFSAAQVNVHRDRTYESGLRASGQRTVFARDNPSHDRDFIDAWADQLALLNHNPIAHRTLTAESHDEVVTWLMEGDGKRYYDRLREAKPQQFKTRRQVSGYIRKVERRAQILTGGNTDLLTAVQTGRLNDIPLFGSAPEVNRKFRNALGNYRDEAAPEFIPGTLREKLPRNMEETEAYNRVLDRAFAALMGAPDNKLLRSPTYRQFYWRNVAELMPFVRDEHIPEILENAARSNLSRRQMHFIEHMAGRPVKTAKPKLTMQEFNDFAKSYALEDTNDLLYQLSDRGQFWDIMRTVIPFGDAWREIIKTWGGLATFRGPFGAPIAGAAPVTGAKTIQALQSPDVGELIGSPEGKGFFWENEWGDPVFVWPGSQFLMNWSTGVPVPLSSPVQGLNMFGTFFPGIGPAAQIPVAWILEDKPELDFLRRELFPYGMPNREELWDTVFDVTTPSWAKSAYQFITGSESDRLFANTVMQTDNYLASTGEYGNTIEEQQRRLSDARNKSRKLFGIRAIAQFILPAPPSVEHMIQDSSGQLLRTRMVSERYAQLMDEDPDTAVERFVDEFGWDALRATRPRSVTVPGRVIDSAEGADWLAQNSYLKEAYPYTYGFFAPQGEFDYEVWQQNFLSGEVKQLKPREYQQMYDQFMGNYHYQRAKEMTGGRRDEAALQWLRDARHTLTQYFPGFGFEMGVPGVPKPATTEDLINELSHAASDPELRNTETGQALNIYLGLRQQAIQAAIERSDGQTLHFKDARSTMYLREWLERNANHLIQAYPSFEQLWLGVFSDETRGPGPRTLEEVSSAS